MSNNFEKAINYSVQKHNGQFRKDGSIYILHPLEVATIVGTMTNDLDVLSAAVLHDIVEDSSVTINEIVDEFGVEIAKLVASETEDKMDIINKKDSWKLRKINSIKVLQSTNDIRIKMIWLGDKLANLRSIAREYNKIQDGIFDLFNETNPLEHSWYYFSILNNIKELSDFSAYKEYEYLCHNIFDKYKKEVEHEENNKAIR